MARKMVKNPKEKDSSGFEYGISYVRGLFYEKLKNQKIAVIRPLLDVLTTLLINNLKTRRGFYKITQMTPYDRGWLIVANGGAILLTFRTIDIHNSSTENGNFDLYDTIWIRGFPVSSVSKRGIIEHIDVFRCQIESFFQKYADEGFEDLKKLASSWLRSANLRRLDSKVIKFYGLESE